MQTYGARDLARNPSLFRIDPGGAFMVEDKRAHKRLGLYLGADLAEEFLAFQRKKRMLDAAEKIRSHATDAYSELEATLDDGL